jgi:hypothetical protein
MNGIEKNELPSKLYVGPLTWILKDLEYYDKGI